MSLRARLIAFFFILAVAPLAGIGVLSYTQSLRALRGLLGRQTGAIADRVAGELQDRYELRESELRLLSENAETQALYRARASGDAARTAAAHSAADAYLRSAWAVLGRSYDEVEFRDEGGQLVYRLGPPIASGPLEPTPARGLLTIRKPIVDAQRSAAVGTLLAAVRSDALLPTDVLATGFGRAGYTMVVDRAAGEVLYHPRHAGLRQSLTELLGPSGWDVPAAALARGRGTFIYRQADSTRVAAFVALESPPWTVLSSAAVDEFVAPFSRTRNLLLALVLLVTCSVAVAFVLLTRRATRSLLALSAAADEVGAGNFAPALPPPSRDEVGRLSSAFGLMAGKVHEMLREVSASRHMAAVGEFAAKLSHEIRNPLTSIKLNLQRLERNAALHDQPPEARAPLAICLREIERLDRVVRGVLTLGREPAPQRVRCALHETVGDALAVVRAQLDEQGVTVQTSFRASTDQVLGDPEHLRAVFLNLFLNAAEAMPDGGRLQVTTESDDAPPGAARRIRVRVADTGGGIRPELREKIFQPFYSTKPHGTGFGLPLAARTVEEHGGRIELLPDSESGGGAAFIVKLPLAPPETQA
jgi:signal transduction histidine kinase